MLEKWIQMVLSNGRTIIFPVGGGGGVCSTSTGSSWAFPFAKTWIASLLYPSTILSEIVKPLSAPTVSPGNNLSKNSTVFWKKFVRGTSTQTSETKDTVQILEGFYQLELLRYCGLVRREHLGSSQQMCWSIDEHFKAINDHSHPSTKCVLKAHRHSFP